MAAAAATPLVQVEDVTVRFGGVMALDGVSFDVAAGSLTAVIGPNGAGKTSLFNCMSGIYRPTSGRILCDGTDVTRLSQHRIARLGVARTFQTPALFGGLSVLENIMLGRYRHTRAGILAGMFWTPRAVRDEITQREHAERVIDLLEISRYRRAQVRDLPYGLQKRVELGRALAQEPRLLLLDEPMAGMNLEEKEDMCAFMLDAREEMGTTLVLVEHDMGVVMDIAEHVVVLDFGKRIGEGPPAEVQRDPAVIAAYLGSEGVTEEVRAAALAAGEPS
jgi:branched-chain amino acid transport system ATP-binding protein